MTYTSIEQSKRLIELGLKSATADMCWMGDKIPEPVPYDPALEQFNTESFVFLPCWSAECLLNLLPDIIKTGDEVRNWYWININKEPYQISYGNDLGSSGEWHDMVNSSQSYELIGAVYNMMEWLLETSNKNEFPFDNDLNKRFIQLIKKD